MERTYESVDHYYNYESEIKHPFHPYHPLKLIPDKHTDFNGICGGCEGNISRAKYYHCSICDYNMHTWCSDKPPPLTVDAPRCHEHTLVLMTRIDRYTCNACGDYGERCPFVCASCSLMFHHDCITLPHVININRHDDRISHSYSLGFGDRKCPICHKMIDWRYGAYSCAKCSIQWQRSATGSTYVVHSKCATRKDVWDGVELEGVPEEVFDVSPFKVIEEGVINHFSHEKHNLRIEEEGIEHVLCEACVHPIFSEKHYKCMKKCNYTLHEICANLPLQKRHGLCTKPLTLNIPKNDDLHEDFFACDACNRLSNGFRYKHGRHRQLDVRCATISYYCDYECHPHTLFLTTTTKGICGYCHKDDVYVLNCVECVYSLCFECVTLPKKIKHRSDDHFLLLRYGEKADQGKYWCEVCETVLDQQKWFYTCDDCVVVCHIECVLGDFVNAKPGIMIQEDKEIQLVSNDGMTRPICSVCGFRCKLPLNFVLSGGVKNVICNLKCLETSYPYW